MSVWASWLEAIGFLENLLNRYTPRMPCEPVFAVIDTETTGFNKRYDRIIGLAAVRADAYFNPVDSWHTLLTPDTNAVFTTRGTPPVMVASTKTMVKPRVNNPTESVRFFVCGGVGLQVVRESVGVSHG